MKAAVAGLFVLVALLVVNIVTVLLVSPNGGIVVEDVLIGVGVMAIVIGICRRASWSRYTGVAVAALFAIGAASQFRAGIPGHRRRRGRGAAAGAGGGRRPAAAAADR